MSKFMKNNPLFAAESCLLKIGALSHILHDQLEMYVAHFNTVNGDESEDAKMMDGLCYLVFRYQRLGKES